MEFVDTNLNEKKGFFGKTKDSIKRIPSSIKNLLYLVKDSYSSSWKLQLILKTFLLLFFINVVLMFIGTHYEVRNNPEDVFTNGFYLTTTQLTTIGYGDITPKSNLAKMITSAAHLVVLYIAYNLAEEFGAISKIVYQQEKLMQDNFRPLEKKLAITPEFKDEVMKNHAIGKRRDAVSAESNTVPRIRPSLKSVGKEIIRTNRVSNIAIDAMEDIVDSGRRSGSTVNLNI